jgi:hypothetical protein
MTASTQRQTILRYLQTHGTMTTLEARNLLFIMHPASRIQKLREAGFNIETIRLENRVAKYVMGSKQVKP